MSSPLKQNTEKIQNLLNDINNLPSAGQENKVESCVVTLITNTAQTQIMEPTIFCTLADGQESFQTLFPSQAGGRAELTIVKNSIIVLYRAFGDFQISGDRVSILQSGSDYEIYIIKGDCTIQANN